MSSTTEKNQQPLSVTDKSAGESTDSNIRYAGYASRFRVSSRPQWEPWFYFYFFPGIKQNIDVNSCFKHSKVQIANHFLI